MSEENKKIKMRGQTLARVKKFCNKQLSSFEAAYAKKSRVAAVKAFCTECMGYTPSEVRGCTALACPLYEYRPFQVRSGDLDKEKRRPIPPGIKKYQDRCKGMGGTV